MSGGKSLEVVIFLEGFSFVCILVLWAVCFVLFVFSTRSDQRKVPSGYNEYFPSI